MGHGKGKGGRRVAAAALTAKRGTTVRWRRWPAGDHAAMLQRSEFSLVIQTFERKSSRSPEKI